MNKQEFLVKLHEGLNELPQDNIEERITFYSEIIDDRIEEGLTEEDAVSAIGSVDDIVSQIIDEIPFSSFLKEKIKPKKRLRVWEIILLVLGSPIWLSLLIALFVAFVSLYVSLWSIIISLWAVFASFVGAGFGSVIAGIIFACNGNSLTGIATIGAGLVCSGFSIFVFYLCQMASKGILILSKKLLFGLKNSLSERSRINEK